MKRIALHLARRLVRRLALAVALCGACGPALPSPAQQADVLTYEAAQIEAQRKCVREATTVEASHVCRARARAEVDAAYGRGDAGAP